MILVVLFFFSFMTDYQLEVEGRIIVTCRQITAGQGVNEEIEERLYPPRHKITLPLNGLNVLFDDISVIFNHHTKVESDR